MITVQRQLDMMANDAPEAELFFPDDVPGAPKTCVGALREMLGHCPPDAEISGFEVADNDEIIGIEIVHEGRTRVVRIPRNT